MWPVLGMQALAIKETGAHVDFWPVVLMVPSDGDSECAREHVLNASLTCPRFPDLFLKFDCRYIILPLHHLVRLVLLDSGFEFEFQMNRYWQLMLGCSRLRPPLHPHREVKKFPTCTLHKKSQEVPDLFPSSFGPQPQFPNAPFPNAAPICQEFPDFLRILISLRSPFSTNGSALAMIRMECYATIRSTWLLVSKIVSQDSWVRFLIVILESVHSSCSPHSEGCTVSICTPMFSFGSRPMEEASYGNWNKVETGNAGMLSALVKKERSNSGLNIFSTPWRPLKRRIGVYALRADATLVHNQSSC